jgi:outer membrane immunogenic protein
VPALSRVRTAPTNGCARDEQAIEYSLRLGFDEQFGNVVAGFVLEGGRTEARSDVTGFTTTPASYTISREIDFMIDLRARAGFTVTPSTLVYATAGGSYARLDQDFSTTNITNTSLGIGGRDTHGFVVGGGVEQKLGRAVSLGLEYLYRQYDDEEFTVRLGRGTSPATSPFILGNAEGTDFRRSSDQFELHSLRAVLHFRFR